MMTACQREELPPVTEVTIDSLVITHGYVDAKIVCRFYSNVSIERAMLYLSTDSDFSEVEEVTLEQQSDEVFTATLTNLIDGMTYYVRYRISNSWSKVILEETGQFTTYPISAPVMGDTKISDITFNSAIINGTMIRTGGKTIFSRGVVYGVAANPTIENATKIAITDSEASLSCFLGGLEKNTTYYARPFAENELGVSYGQEVCFEVDTLWNGYNLGLSVNWAHVNIGAVSLEDVGDYFAWGETSPKNEYTWVNYKYSNGTYGGMTKYSYKDSLTVLDAQDDAATANWGGKWRMPTSKEINELCEKCRWEWKEINGVGGFVVWHAAQSIFIPANVKGDPHKKGCYWGKTLSYDEYARATTFNISPKGYDPQAGVGNTERWRGLPVRAVCPKK
jgi:hypothetical protein